MPTILVIDDETSFRTLLLEMLQGHGYAVIEAESGQQGLQVARSRRPDLILSDVRMANGDGYFTLQGLHEDPATATIPFIFMTGEQSPDGARTAMRNGADDFLLKPFGISELIGAVEARLRKHALARELSDRKLRDLKNSLCLMLPHELNTPLSGIMGYGELLVHDAPHLAPDDLRMVGQNIVASGQRLHRLIQNFLLYGQLEALDSEGFRDSEEPRFIASVRDFVEGLGKVRAGRDQREKDVKVIGADFPVVIRQGALAKIVDELLDNAFKFSAPGSAVSIHVTNAGKTMQIKIADQGRGMTSEQIKVTAAFTQFDRSIYEQQGCGLGLYIARKMVALLDGELVIASQPGAGTQVTLSVPSE